MDTNFTPSPTEDRHRRLLTTLGGLLAIQAQDAKTALNQATDLIAEVLGADKVDIFLYDPAIDTLVAMGTSNTPMGRLQQALGLDRLALSNGGKTADVFQTGEPYHSGRVDQDLDELRGIREGLKVRSAMVTPLVLEGTRRGTIQVDSTEPDRFSSDDLAFLQAVTHWVAITLHRAELIQRVTQDAAEQARHATANELITMLAHDLRAPLTPVKGYLGLIQQEAQRQGHQGYLPYIQGAQRGMNRLERMLRNLTDTTRLEQGLFALQPEVVDLAALVQDTAATLGTPNTPVDVRTPEQLVSMLDPNSLRQALENLVGNALRYSPEGVPVVVELVGEKRAAGNWAVITVRDAGPGIAPELQPKIFTRFAAAGQLAGLGLGLYLARSIAEAHGGTLTVESTPGQGATFRLELPLDETQRHQRR